MNPKKTRPLLSIIVPVYNGSGYLDELLTCLEGQLSEETELVFVDDGSRDDSFEKLLAWKSRTAFPVTVCRQENRGVSAARNRGMELAKGEYLTFVDVDDTVAEDYIAILCGYARQGMDMLVFDSRRVREGTKLIAARADPAPYPRTKEQMLAEFLFAPARFGVCNLLVRRSVLQVWGIRFSEGYKYYEDYDFLLQLFARAEEIFRLDRVLYDYVLRTGSAMGRFNADRINCLKLIRRREEWLAEFVPGFSPVFRQWGVARLYWSVLWQAALALEDYREFSAFAEATQAKAHLARLKGYPDRLVRLSCRVFLCCRPGYFLGVRLLGRRKSKVSPAALDEILPLLDTDILFD